MHNALIPLLVLGVVATTCDLRSRRIPNLVTFGAALAAFGYHLLTGGPAAAGWSLAGWIVGCALFLPLFLLRGMGAGDVKLLAAVGAWVGPADAFWAAVFATLAGAVLALGVALARGYLTPAVKNVWLMLCYWRVAGVRPFDEVTLGASRGPRLAYALPIAVGSLLAVWLK